LVPRPADACRKLRRIHGRNIRHQSREPARDPHRPNGDLFVAETRLGQIKIFRGRDKDGKPQQVSEFATGLTQPFGIAFYPRGPNPQWVYVGNTNSVVRLPYRNGDLKATAPAEEIVPHLPTGGHSTRDLAFSLDSKRLFVAVGSGSNINDPDRNPGEFHRANILEYTTDGKFRWRLRIRHPQPCGHRRQPHHRRSLVLHQRTTPSATISSPTTSPTSSQAASTAGPGITSEAIPIRLEGKHPELKVKVIVPDVLLQPHNASLALTFYDGAQFPREYSGDLFAAEHGSWNRANRTGYEVIRVPLDNGHASGVFEDFITGFVTPGGEAWGRPVGVTVAQDGSLYFTDDGTKSIWRVSYVGK
jgi:glucose/arabinose dehydrogenase